jgi:hypothetical protein
MEEPKRYTYPIMFGFIAAGSYRAGGRPGSNEDVLSLAVAFLFGFVGGLIFQYFNE